MAATTAKAAPTKRLDVLLFPCGARLNSRATRVAPKVCPSNLAVPIMPLAPPLRLVGADDMMVLLFGVWNNPKPAPQTAIR